MDGTHISPKRALWALLALFSCAGCGEPVQESREINWDEQGGDVGFQHGQQGIFVADREGGGLTKVFQPDENVIASSSPLWSPTDKRLIFTTAARVVDPDDDSPGIVAVPEWDASPAGRIYSAGNIKYTCWLREEPKESETQREPRAIFNAACDHPGYVAANLAVRWHPDGERILFVDHVGDGLVGLFEFELATGERRQILDKAASALIFDFSPNGSQLACVVASRVESVADDIDGVWIRNVADQSPWWRVPGSRKLERGRHASLLEELRATRPAWSNDGRRFALVNERAAETADEAASFALVSVEVASRETRETLISPISLRDLHWHPDGERIGLVVAGEQPTVRIIDQEDRVSRAMNSHRAVRLAGWDATGRRLAYVAPDEVPTHREKNWAVLMTPNRQGRNRVFVIDHAAGDAERQVHAGMRVTFPRWSPKNDELSLWVTFTPTHRSWMAQLFSAWSLQPGDPAAILDMRSGELRWLAVNAHEKTQVGHYWLLKRNYEQAWEWYEKAAAERPTSQASQQRRPAPIGRLPVDDEAFVFQYICLSKLGRKDEAAERLASFRETISSEAVLSWSEGTSRGAAPDSPETQTDDSAATDATATDAPVKEKAHSGASSEDAAHDAATRDAIQLFVPLVQDMYIAEVYLSLDLPADGAAFFEQSLERATTDQERLSRTVALAQLLLLSEQHSEYVDVVNDGLVPLLLKLRPPDVGTESAQATSENTEMQRMVFVGFGGGAMLPMFAPEFLETVPAEQVKRLLPTWNDRRERARDEVERLVADLILQAAHGTLGNDAERDRASQRVAANPQSRDLLGDDGIAGLVDRLTVWRQLADSATNSEPPIIETVD